VRIDGLKYPPEAIAKARRAPPMLYIEARRRDRMSIVIHNTQDHMTYSRES